MPVIGHDDKRQITVCVASSMNGDLLPLQLIFQGKTGRCLPPSSPASTAAGFHLTYTDNHWSTQEAMKQYVHEVIVPYSKAKMQEFSLPDSSKIVLVLDVWSVHKSEEFRFFLRTKHPNIHVVFVPPNCTSQLQVADAILQRPFKQGIRNCFSQWAAEMIRDQLEEGEVHGLHRYLNMASLKPKILQECLESWSRLKEGAIYIQNGWKKCVLDHFDFTKAENIAAAAREAINEELDHRWVPD